MSYYVNKTRNKLIILAVLLVFFIIYYFAPVYKCKNVDRKSEWYVNDIYMSNQYYYNNLLNDKEKVEYKKMFEHIKNMDKKIVIDLNSNEIGKVWDALICDHPELINLSTFSYRGYNTFTEMYPIYLTTSKFKLRSMERKVQRKIGQVVNKAKRKSDFEKEKIVYEYLGKNNAYGRTLTGSDQSAYTVFSFSNTVCAGYGKAAQILLGNLDVKSWININTEHLWNTVELEGEYYFFDATCSSVFFRSLDGVYDHISYMGLNQNKNTSSYSILYPEVTPNISGTTYNYYDYMGLSLTYNDKDLSEIKRIIDNSKYKIVEIKFKNPDEAISGLKRHLSELGLYAVYQYSGYCSGNGVVVLRKN